jgi:hypothetical protein
MLYDGCIPTFRRTALPYFILKMEAALSFETLVSSYHTTRLRSPEKYDFYLTAVMTSNVA